jgi:type I restriction enzyme M protein
VPVDEVRENGYDLGINRYREVAHTVTTHIPPSDILATLRALEADIARDLVELEQLIS